MRKCQVRNARKTRRRKRDTGGHAGTSIYGELGRKGRKKEVVEVDIDVGECDS